MKGGVLKLPMQELHKRELTNALAQHKAGRIGMAQATYQQLLNLYPLNFDLMHLLGLTYLQSGDSERGETLIVGALKLNPKSATAYNNLGKLYRAKGELQKARVCYNKAIETNPEYPIALVNRGYVLLALGLPQDALRDFQNGLILDPLYPDAHNGRGNAFFALGRSTEALADYDKAIALKPGYAEAYSGQGIVLSSLGRLEEALAAYDKAIALKPNSAEIYSNRSNILLALKRVDEALASCNRAITLKPDYAEAYCNRGNILADLRRLEDALESFDKSLSYYPELPEAHNGRGSVLFALRRLDEALASFDKAIILKPGHAEAHNNRGNVLVDLGRLDEALASYDKAMSLKPDYASAYSNRGNALKELGQFRDALSSYDRAININPGYSQAQYNMANLLLFLGQYSRGFGLFGSRWKTPDFPSTPLRSSIPQWDGSSFDGELLLWAEQGVGDEVLFASMLSLIPDERIRVTLCADKRLHSIYARSFPNIRFLNRSFQKERIDRGFDAQASIGDLGAVLNVDTDKLQRRRYPFLVASEERKSDIRRKNKFLTSSPVCGISWKSSNKQFGKQKSVTLTDLAPFISDTDISFVNLQYGDVAAEIQQARGHGAVIRQAEELDVFNDLEGLLALIDVCDIVLTTSNVTAHLAGAIGKKAVVLVPNGKGRLWYWHGEPNSSWYPSLRIIAQGSNSDWRSSLQQAFAIVRENV